MVELKTCNECEIEKSINEFHKNCETKDGLLHRCKKCQLKRVMKSDSVRADVLMLKYGMLYKNCVYALKKNDEIVYIGLSLIHI